MSIPIILANVMSRIGNSNRLNNNSNKNEISDKDHIIPKEEFISLTPESQEFWNSAPTKEKASILGRARDKPKLKPPFSKKGKNLK